MDFARNPSLEFALQGVDGSPAASAVSSSVLHELPASLRDSILAAQKLYKVRLFRPSDQAEVTRMFVTGFSYYAQTQGNIQYLCHLPRARDPWASSSASPELHEILPLPEESPEDRARRRETRKTVGVQLAGYATREAEGPTIADIPNYWNPSRGGCFLVAEHIETGELASMVALHPVKKVEDEYGNVSSEYLSSLRSLASSSSSSAEEEPPLPPTAPAWAWGQRKCAAAVAAIDAAAAAAAAAAASCTRDGLVPVPVSVEGSLAPEDLAAVVASGSMDPVHPLAPCFAPASAPAPSVSASSSSVNVVDGRAIPAQLRVPYSECELKRVSVAPTHRGSGAGPLIVFAAIDAAKLVFGYHSVHLSTAESMHAAMAFYLKHGFKHVFTRECFFLGMGFPFPIAHFSWPVSAAGRQVMPFRDLPSQSFYVPKDAARLREFEAKEAAVVNNSKGEAAIVSGAPASVIAAEAVDA